MSKDEAIKIIKVFGLTEERRTLQVCRNFLNMHKNE